VSMGDEIMVMVTDALSMPKARPSS